MVGGSVGIGETEAAATGRERREVEVRAAEERAMVVEVTVAVERA